MPLSAVRQFRRSRAFRVSHAVVLCAGVIFGYLVAEYGGVVRKYPVESVLLVILAAAVVTLWWACRRWLGDASRRVAGILGEELGSRDRRRP
ncbi:hypothetical protein ACFWY9_12190 [Amycolatopsis sp. NPDC059027]|uniref:hypothetical protein n=1 Tax=Amycolatopsis sp. NPDC059027 TaxID=3346709 RepID=UPI00367051ED